MEVDVTPSSLASTQDLTEVTLYNLKSNNYKSQRVVKVNPWFWYLRSNKTTHYYSLSKSMLMTTAVLKRSIK